MGGKGRITNYRVVFLRLVDFIYRNAHTRRAASRRSTISRMLKYSALKRIQLNTQIASFINNMGNIESTRKFFTKYRTVLLRGDAAALLRRRGGGGSGAYKQYRTIMNWVSIAYMHKWARMKPLPYIPYKPYPYVPHAQRKQQYKHGTRNGKVATRTMPTQYRHSDSTHARTTMHTRKPSTRSTLVRSTRSQTHYTHGTQRRSSRRGQNTYKSRRRIRTITRRTSPRRHSKMFLAHATRNSRIIIRSPSSARGALRNVLRLVNLLLVNRRESADRAPLLYKLQHSLRVLHVENVWSASAVQVHVALVTSALKLVVTVSYLLHILLHARYRRIGYATNIFSLRSAYMHVAVSRILSRGEAHVNSKMWLGEMLHRIARYNRRLAKSRYTVLLASLSTLR